MADGFARVSLGERLIQVGELRYACGGLHRMVYVSARVARSNARFGLGSYTEIAAIIRHDEADRVEDCLEIHRRLIFTILVSSEDDYLQNHRFLCIGSDKWRLSPLFDVNPAPDRNVDLDSDLRRRWSRRIHPADA